MWPALTASPWRGPAGKRLVRFSTSSHGTHQFRSADLNDKSRSDPDALHPLWIRGTTVVLDSRSLELRCAFRRLFDPRDLANRLSPAIHGEPIPAPDLDAARLLSDPDLLARTRMAFEAGELRNSELGPALIECTKHGFAPLPSRGGERSRKDALRARRRRTAIAPGRPRSARARTAAARALQKLEIR